MLIRSQGKRAVTGGGGAQGNRQFIVFIVRRYVRINI